MGEMIKFGIKMAMTIAIAVGIMAAVALVFSIIGNLLTTSASVGNAAILYFNDIMKLVSIVFPFDLTMFTSVITGLYAYKIAYWAQDKLLELTDAAG